LLPFASTAVEDLIFLVSTYRRAYNEFLIGHTGNIGTLAERAFESLSENAKDSSHFLRNSAI